MHFRWRTLDALKVTLRIPNLQVSDSMASLTNLGAVVQDSEQHLDQEAMQTK